jgi:hypothetical protein
MEETPGDQTLDDLQQDYKGRANRASGYLYQMLGNHLLLKQDPELRSAYDRVDRALTELCDLTAGEQLPRKVAV